jgi:hypothetical protein
MRFLPLLLAIVLWAFPGKAELPAEETVSALPVPQEEARPPATVVEDAERKQLYLTVSQRPEHLFKGQVFFIELKAVVTTRGFEKIDYRFEGGRGIERLGDEPEHREEGHTLYDRFYFKVTGNRAVLPRITPYIVFSSYYAERYSSVEGDTIEVTALNPPEDFCGVLATQLKILHTKTPVYDQNDNILVFMADANGSNLEDFHIPQAGNQGFETLSHENGDATMTYYAVLPKNVKILRLSYFNLPKRAFERIAIPIVIDDDSVSTQSDLKPTEQGHNYLKAIAFAALGGIALLYFVFRRSFFALALAIGLGGYAAWLGTPIRTVCIEKGSAIYLLPVYNATVFEIAPTRYDLEVQGHVEGYTKVKLHNNKIGWVKDEDTCAY